MDEDQSLKEVAPCRIALVDLDEREASVLEALRERSDCRIGIVAGERPDDPGVRAATVLGIAWTTDLSDLTRQVFDVALIGESSPRRGRVESLMRAVGTTVMAPQRFSPIAGSTAVPATPTSARLRVVHAGEAASSVETPPTPDEPADVERWLAALLVRSGASAARLVRGGARPRVVAHVGDADPMLETLSGLALQIGQPQVVSRLDGPGLGRAAGSWPIATTFFNGALTAAGLGSTPARAMWEEAARDLSRACRERSGRCESVRGDWLEPTEFLGRVRVAIGEGGEERHSLYRLQFEGPASAVDIFCRGVTSRLRTTDALCRPGPDQVLLLCSGTPVEFVHVRRRIADLWDEVCRAAGLSPTLLMSDERIEMSSPGGAELMFAAAAGWTRPERLRTARS